MERSRYVGHNVALLMKKNNVDITALASYVGYSVNDFKKLLDARLTRMPATMKKIADILRVNVAELLIEKDNSEYECFLDRMTPFEQPENKDMILDIIDQYCNLKEVLN